MSNKPITTVTGEMAAGSLGPTLTHEHLWCDVSVHSGKADNVLMNVKRTVDELQHFRSAGGRSIIEVTPVGIGRDPVRLREISESSGVQIICGIAFYDKSTYPDWLWQASVGQIADYFVRQIEEGTDGVHAGIIGELTSHNEPQPNMSGYRLHDIEVGIFEAAAQAQRRTGLAITTHASLGRGGHAQLKVLEDAGADLNRVCIGHCDAHWHENPDDDLAYYLPILEQGAFCQFDLIGWRVLAPDEIRADRVAALVQLGYEGQILLSTDTCRLSQLHVNAGRGYDYLWTSFLPRLRQRGVTEAQIESMMVTGPKRFLAGA